MSTNYFLAIIPWYLLTIMLESPWIILGIAKHSLLLRVIAAFGLTAFTYPMLAFVFRYVIPDPLVYMVVSEVYAPAVEVLLFWLIADRKSPRSIVIRNASVIVAANLFSFGVGELLKAQHLI